MEKINIPKIVSDIKEAEAARSNWRSYCEQNGIGKRLRTWWSFPSYEDHVTSLYTLRAWCRGRMHRKNPPAPIRDFNRTMEEQGSSERIGWDMEKHNRNIAEKTAKDYLLIPAPKPEASPNPENKAKPEKPKSFFGRIFG